MDKLEEKLSSNNVPSMCTWPYHNYSFPKTTTHNHASDMVQVPTGYKWNIGFPQGSVEGVQVIIDKLVNFQ
ncbi:MAG: hypothetical protein ACKPKO_55115, partial [Candidatus Fonsibacter sp.]